MGLVPGPFGPFGRGKARAYSAVRDGAPVGEGPAYGLLEGTDAAGLGGALCP